jgi:hypothetical protein
MGIVESTGVTTLEHSKRKQHSTLIAAYLCLLQHRTWLAAYTVKRSSSSMIQCSTVGNLRAVLASRTRQPCSSSSAKTIAVPALSAGCACCSSVYSTCYSAKCAYRTQWRAGASANRTVACCRTQQWCACLRRAVVACSESSSNSSSSGR